MTEPNPDWDVSSFKLPAPGSELRWVGISTLTGERITGDSRQELDSRIAGRLGDG